MKILQVTSVPITYPGGMERVILELSKKLVIRGHEVTVLQTNFYDEKKDYPKEVVIDGVRIITCKNDYSLGGLGYSGEFKQELKKIWKSFDVIHIHGHGRFTSNYSLSYLKGKKPLIYTAHGFFHSGKNSFAKKLYNSLFARRLNNASFCTALTELEEEEYVKLGVDKKKIKILPNWIDLEYYKRIPVDRSDFLKRHGLDPKKKTLVFVGRVHESKGIHYVIDAIKDLEVNFLIVGGDSGYLEAIKDKVKETKQENKIKFYGPAVPAQLKEIYSACDFLVLFSEWEGFGLVILEAMAYGLPVVVSDKGALPLLVSDGKNGMVAKFRDVKNLREKIERIVSDKKLAQKISKNEISFVKEFDSKSVIKKYEQMYEQAKK
jgi:glycosyltransferase involved in cell wall biosynthesis